MAWPVSQDYNEAIQNPSVCFADAELRQGEAAVSAIDLPCPCSGNVADVYEVRTPGGARWAVKCFTRQVPGLRERYAAIGEHLRRVPMPFTVDFHYLPEGIRVLGRWYPVLKMRWVQGRLLNDYVRDALDEPATLDELLHTLVQLSRRLRAGRLAHGDLQHGNMLLTSGTDRAPDTVKLIEYDGMWLPALASGNSGETGHPNYQHPQRQREGTYSDEVDRFPLLAMAVTLRCLQAGCRPH